MPTYDYDCEACSDTFELFQSISEPPADTCPKCGGPVKRRIHGGAGLIFKGSGFYLTDYKKPAKSGEGKSESGEEKAQAGNGTVSGEKTPDKKTSSEATKKSSTSKAPLPSPSQGKSEGE